jgi:UDP-glucose 4-epimerase
MTTAHSLHVCLITGGAGFIGSHLVERLLAEGARVTVIDNLRSGRRENLARVRDRIEFLDADLAEALRSGRLDVGRFDCVFHVAANAYIPPSVEDPMMDYRANVENTLLLLDAIRRAAKPPRLVNTSSAGVYGNPARLPVREEDPVIPISPYGAGKLAGDRYVEVFSRLYGIRANSLRLFSVYGPRQRKQVVFDILRKMKVDPRRIELVGDGTQTRDFVYVTDVAEAMVLAATVAPGRGEVYNVASGAMYSIADLVQAWMDVTGLCPEVAYTGKVRPGDAERWEVDLTALRALGYAAKVHLKDGLTAIREWYEEEGGRRKPET